MIDGEYLDCAVKMAEKLVAMEADLAVLKHVAFSGLVAGRCSAP